MMSYLRNTARVAGLLASIALAPMALASDPALSSTPFGGAPPAEPGECFARILVPARYDTVTDPIVLQDGGERIETSEARFAPREQSIETREAGVRYAVRQPVYETISETVMVRPAYERLVVEPAQYETVTETVEVAAPRLVWRPGADLVGARDRRVDASTGAVYCLVEEPGETRTVERQVLVRAESVRSVAVPAEYRIVERQVLVDRGGVEETAVPAEYGTVSVQEIASPAAETRITVPPRMGTIERRVLAAPERYDWVSVLCETNATPDAINRVQRGLREHGYYNGPIDGVMGPQTEDALRRFQREQGLPHEGYLSLETLERLESRVHHEMMPDGQPHHDSFTYETAGPADLMGAAESASVSSTTVRRHEVRTSHVGAEAHDAYAAHTPAVVVYNTGRDGRVLDWAGKN